MINTRTSGHMIQYLLCMQKHPKEFLDEWTWFFGRDDSERVGASDAGCMHLEPPGAALSDQQLYDIETQHPAPRACCAIQTSASTRGAVLISVAIPCCFFFLSEHANCWSKVIRYEERVGSMESRSKVGGVHACI